MLLVSLPVVGVPFERITMGLVGPLLKSNAGFQYILILMDYTTCFPEAMPLENTTTHTIAAELVKVFACMGLPCEILMDQGTNFTLRLCTLLGIKKLQTSVYLPQTDGLVEHFNRTLKEMLKMFSPTRATTVRPADPTTTVSYQEGTPIVHQILPLRASI